MSFSEMLAALWRRKWIIVAVTVLAALVAVLYLGRQDPNYESSTSARVSALMSDSIGSGLIASVPVDVDPSLLQTPEMIQEVAGTIGQPPQALYGHISYSLVEGARASSLVIDATGPSPEASWERAGAAMAVYAQFLDDAVAETLGILQTRLENSTTEARAYQAQLAANPNDLIASANLSTALADISSINTQISGLQNAGPPLTVTIPAQMGASTNPSPMIVGAVALLCGLLAGAGIALVRDRFDDRIRSEDEIEPLTGVPAIAVLADDRKVARKKSLLPAASAERTALSEGIRSFRTSAQVLLDDGKGVLVLTSVEPGDGKTFLSANLALSWARTGRKVILVGGDLRRPQLGHYFPTADDGPGLAGLLADVTDGGKGPTKTQIVDALRSTPYRGLKVLPAGKDDEHEPADQLAGTALDKVVAVLAGHADIVVIDSPPALSLADASELASRADGVVVLATINRTRRGLLEDTVASLAANGASVLGVVANRSRRKLPRRYASYYVESRAPQGAKPPPRSTGTVLEDDEQLRAADEGDDEVVTSPSDVDHAADAGSRRDRLGNRTENDAPTNVAATSPGMNSTDESDTPVEESSPATEAIEQDRA
ncbi:Wzz/FepE/Etk N-terminal domain-containing protein [Microbacterium lacticum]